MCSGGLQPPLRAYACAARLCARAACSRPCAHTPRLFWGRRYVLGRLAATLARIRLRRAAMCSGGLQPPLRAYTAPFWGRRYVLGRLAATLARIHRAFLGRKHSPMANTSLPYSTKSRTTFGFKKTEKSRTACGFDKQARVPCANLLKKPHSVRHRKKPHNVRLLINHLRFALVPSAFPR